VKAAAGVLWAVWLVVGMFAAGQRHYLDDALGSCDTTATVAATIAVGPLNYQGLNPSISCPQPSA